MLIDRVKMLTQEYKYKLKPAIATIFECYKSLLKIQNIDYINLKMWIIKFI